MSFLIALAVLALGWWAIRTFAVATPNQARAYSQRIAAYGLLALAGFVALRGQFEFAVPLAALALGMLGYQNVFGRRAGDASGPAQEPPPRGGKLKMSRDEALRVLGLGPHATADDIKAAHRKLLKDYHPDKGGTDYLAAKINEAKDVLMQ